MIFVVLVICICLIAVILVARYTENKSSDDYHQFMLTKPFAAQESSHMYGCPGCPDNFMDFAQDMCNRVGSSYTVEDGISKVSCSEILNQVNHSNNTDLVVRP
jgi:hypothetical protein